MLVVRAAVDGVHFAQVSDLVGDSRRPVRKFAMVVMFTSWGIEQVLRIVTVIFVLLIEHLVGVGRCLARIDHVVLMATAV